MCARACVAEFAVTAMSRPVPPARSPLLGHSVAFISRSVLLSVSVFPRKNTISINRRTRKVFGEHVQHQLLSLVSVGLCHLCGVDT